MAISKRAKFWITVALTATFPVWVLPACALWLLVFFFAMAGGLIADLLDDMTSGPEGKA